MLRDFAWVGLPVGGLSSQVLLDEHGLIVEIHAGDRMLTASAEDLRQLSVAIATFLQEGERLRGHLWPVIPGIGLLSPGLADQQAMWVMPGGGALCRLGEMFLEEPPHRDLTVWDMPSGATG